MSIHIKNKLSNYFKVSNMMNYYTGFIIKNDNLKIFFKEFSVSIIPFTDKLYHTIFKDNNDLIFYKSINSYYCNFNNITLCSMINIDNNIKIFIDEFTILRKFNISSLIYFFNEINDIYNSEYNQMLDSFSNTNIIENSIKLENSINKLSIN